VLGHDLLEVILVLSVHDNIAKLVALLKSIFILAVIKLFLIAEFKIQALGLDPVLPIDLLYLGLVLLIPDVLLHQLLHPFALQHGLLVDQGALETVESHVLLERG